MPHGLQRHFFPCPGDVVHLKEPGWWLGCYALSGTHAESGLSPPGAAAPTPPPCELLRLSAEHKNNRSQSQTHAASCLICPPINSFQVAMARGNICVPSLQSTDVEGVPTFWRHHLRDTLSLKQMCSPLLPPPQPSSVIVCVCSHL